MVTEKSHKKKVIRPRDDLEIKELEDEISRLQNIEKSSVETIRNRIISYGSLSIWIILLYYLIERLAALLLKRLIVTGFPIPGIVASLIVAYTFEPSKRKIFDFIRRHR